MFQKNLEVIRSKNPDLASKLEKIDINSIKNIEVFEAESKDLIISYNKTNLHNPIDPVREAKTAWHKNIKNELRKNDIQVVYGLGLGYLFKRAYVSSNSKIFIIEPFIEVLRFVLEYVDFSQELSDNRVSITDSTEGLLQKLHTDFLSGDKVEFLFLNAYASLAPEMLIKLTQKTLEICELKSMDQNTIFNLCKFWTTNTISNMPYLPESRPVNLLDNICNKKTALIVAAGPSLAFNIAKIKENRDKFIIIAIAPTLKLLINSGITPDFVTFADPNFLHKHIEGVEDKISDVHLVINSRAENCIMTENFKSKIIYFSETDHMALWMRDSIVNDLTLYKSGGTISILSYYFAKALGFDPIAFVGLDLAFINNKIYATGEEVEINSTGNIDICNYFHKKPMYVKGYNGETLLTRDDYALFIRHFEEIFTQEHNPARIINTSVDGALINGMEYMPFDDFIKDLSPQIPDIDQLIQETFQNTADSWLNITQHIYDELVKQNKKIHELDSHAKDIYTELKEVNMLLEEYESKANTIQTKLDNLKNLMINVRNEVINNVFLSTYLQNEIWQYTQKYNTSILPNISDIKHNLKLEYEFFNVVCWATENISKSLDEALPKYQAKLPILKS